MSPQVPQIIILVDEFADLPRAVKERLETISNTGRGAGVRVMTCVLRATMAEIPRPMVVQAATRIAMRVNDEGELQYLFDWGWSTRFDISAATAPGMGWVTCNRQAAQQFQAWRLVPSRIDAVSVELAERRPQLDQVSVALAGPYYPTRWQRVLPIMFPLGSVAPAPRSPVDPTPAVAPMNASKESGMDLEQSADRLRAAMAAVQQAADEADAAGGGRSDDPRLDFEEIEEYLAKQADPMSTPVSTGDTTPTRCTPTKSPPGEQLATLADQLRALPGVAHPCGPGPARRGATGTAGAAAVGNPPPSSGRSNRADGTISDRVRGNDRSESADSRRPDPP